MPACAEVEDVEFRLRERRAGVNDKREVEAVPDVLRDAAHGDFDCLVSVARACGVRAL